MLRLCEEQSNTETFIHYFLCLVPDLALLVCTPASQGKPDIYSAVVSWSVCFVYKQLHCDTKGFFHTITILELLQFIGIKKKPTGSYLRPSLSVGLGERGLVPQSPQDVWLVLKGPYPEWGGACGGH